MPVLSQGYDGLIIFNGYLLTSMWFSEACLRFAAKQFRLAKIELLLQTRELGAQTKIQLFHRILAGEPGRYGSGCNTVHFNS